MSQVLEVPQLIKWILVNHASEKQRTALIHAAGFGRGATTMQNRVMTMTRATTMTRDTVIPIYNRRSVIPSSRPVTTARTRAPDLMRPLYTRQLAEI